MAGERPPETRTADEDEIGRFAAQAGDWWDEEGAFAPLHRINPVRLRFIRDSLCRHFGRDSSSLRPFENLNILDIGCGGGLLTEPMARLGAAVTGIDAAPEGVSAARAHARLAGLEIDYRAMLPEEMAATGRVFDAVLNMEVVEHVADAEAFFEACGRLVRPGGAMAVSTLNRTLKSLAFGKVAAEYILRWVPAGTHDWRQFVKPSELARHLRRAGFEAADLKGMAYDPANGDWSLGGDVGINYLMFAVRR